MRTIRSWAGPALAAATLAIVVWRLGTGPFLAGLKAVDVRAVLAAAGVVLVATLCSAWRWRIVADGLGVRLSLRAAFFGYYRAMFLNLMVPGGVAGDVHRGVSHGREVRDVGRALRAVVWERTAGQVVQVVLTIAVLLVLPSPVRPVMPFVAVAAVGIVVGLVLVSRMQLGTAGSRWKRARIAVASDIRNGVLRRSALPAVVLTSIVVALAHAATFLIAARTVGVTAPISRLLPLALLAVLATALPNVGGWGPREGVTAWLFSAAGLGAGQGAATAVTFGILVLAATLPGALVLVAERIPRRRMSRPREHRSIFRPEGAADA